MRRRDLVSAGIGAAAIGVAIFAIGGATRWAQALVAIVVAAALAPIFGSKRVFARKSPLLVMAALALALVLLQLLPLPHGLLSWLNPTGVGLRDDGAALAGTSPRNTISLDAPATLAALAYFLVLLGVAQLAMRVAITETGRYRILAVVAGLCGLAAVVTGIHWLVDPKALYGLYEPVHAGPRTLAPLLNNNHMGCLMALGAVLSLGLMMYSRQPPWLRAVWLFVTAACALGTLHTWSRGAAVALVLGAFVTLAARVAQKLIANETPRRRRAGFLTSSLPIGVVAACTVIVVVYAGAGGVTQQIESTSITELGSPRSKIVAWRSAGALVEESPWVGIGRGALESTFTRLHEFSAYNTFTHVENEYLQAVLDFGVPGALLLGMAAAWLVVTALRRWRDGPLAAGALGALAVVMLQSNVDFGLELFGIAVPITAVAATLAYVPLREASPREIVIARGMRAVHVLALAVAAALLLADSTTSIEEDHTAIAHRSDLKLADLHDAMERHPLDFYNYQVAAQILMRDHDARAIYFLNHALVLHPTAPSLHLTAAHLLVATGHPQQAALEYAIALAPVRDKHKLIAEIASRFTPDIAAMAFPSDSSWLDEIWQYLAEMGYYDIAAAWLVRVLDREPQAFHACDLLYQVAAKHADTATVSLATTRCSGYQPPRETRIALAKALVAKNDSANIVHVLADVESWPGRSDEKSEAWLLVCDADLALARWDDAKRCLRRLDASGLIPDQRAKEIATRLEQAEAGRAAAATGSGSASR